MLLPNTNRYVRRSIAKLANLGFLVVYSSLLRDEAKEWMHIPVNAANQTTESGSSHKVDLEDGIFSKLPRDDLDGLWESQISFKVLVVMDVLMLFYGAYQVFRKLVWTKATNKRPVKFHSPPLVAYTSSTCKEIDVWYDTVNDDKPYISFKRIYPWY